MFGGGQTPCIVRALSNTSARLQIYAPETLPQTFQLFIQLNNMVVECKSTWRTGKEIGVDFTSVPTTVCASGPALAPLPRPSGVSGNPSGTSIAHYLPAPVGHTTALIPVLIAEDDPDDQMMIGQAFRDSGRPYEMHFVDNGERLLDHLSSAGLEGGNKMPSLILLDLNMPKMDGRTALLRIKQTPDLKRIPVIAFTTSNSDEDIDRTYDLGISWRAGRF